MFSFFKKRRREGLRTQPFPSAWLNIIERNFPIYDRLPQADQQELQGHIQVFLAEKLFEGCGGLELTDEIKVTIAAGACLLLLHRETDYYPRLITILVYPHAYLAKGMYRSAAELFWRARRLGSGRRGRMGWSFFPGMMFGRERRTSTMGTTSCCMSLLTSSTSRTALPMEHRSLNTAASM